MMIRIVLVDDSSLSRMILTKILEADGDIQVVGEAANGFDALSAIERLKPDLVTMDIDLPGPNGLETIERIMHTSPVPILVVTMSESLGPDSDLGFRAIQVGALDYIAKPSVVDEPSMARLREQVRTLAKVPVFLHTEERAQQRAERDSAIPEAPPFSLVAILSPSGLTKSIATILQSLPADFGATVVILLQRNPNDEEDIANKLQALTPFRIATAEARPHDCVPGEVILAGGPDAHLYFPRRGVVVAMTGEPYAGQRPSATVLFRSIAESYGADAVGIILAGTTGDDGVEGLDAMRSAGALTIAETPAGPRIKAARELSAQMIANSLLSAIAEHARKTTAPPHSKA